MPAQMKSFFDATGGLWVKGSLVGKGASIFTSSGTQVGRVRMGSIDAGAPQGTIGEWATFLLHLWMR